MADAIAVVESVYQTATDDRTWLTGICEALNAGSLGAAVGVTGNFFDASDLMRARYWSHVSVGLPESFLTTMEEMERQARPEQLQALFSCRDVATASELLARAGLPLEDFSRWLWKYGVRDMMGITAASPDRRGLVFGFALPSARRPTATERRRWTKVAAHAAAGHRLRNQLARSVAPEAVLRPDGRIEHAELAAKPAAARETLRSAARSVDRARSRLRREDPDGALELWKGLIGGRWSLVDHFEKDGRRYLVARRNEPDVQAAPTLTRREAQVAGYAALGHGNKLIAYELGLSVSTVATHLSAAQHKLGLRSRVDLASVVAGERS